MDVSIFLAKWFGLYMLIVGVIWIFRKGVFVRIVREIFDSPSCLAITGLLSLMLGLAIVIAHPVCEVSWRGLITLLGWLGILKGVMRVGFQDQSRALVTSALRGVGYWIVGLVVLALGAYLTYVGFDLNLF